MTAGDDPVPVGESLEALRRDLELPEIRVLEEIEEVWAEVVPDALRERSSVRGLRRGVLAVESDDPAVASQLRYLESAVVDACARRLRRGLVESVSIRVTAGPDRR